MKPHQQKEYLAPEILQGGKAGKVADFWTLGCLLHRMYFGEPPYKSETVEEHIKLVENGKINLPEDMDDALASLISELLVRDVSHYQPKTQQIN